MTTMRGGEHLQNGRSLPVVSGGQQYAAIAPVHRSRPFQSGLVEKRPPLPVLNFDYPEIAIPAHLSLKHAIDIGILALTHEIPNLPVVKEVKRLLIDTRLAIQRVQPHQNRTCLRIAPGGDKGRYAGGAEAVEVGSNPEIGS